MRETVRTSGRRIAFAAATMLVASATIPGGRAALPGAEDVSARAAAAERPAAESAAPEATAPAPPPVAIVGGKVVTITGGVHDGGVVVLRDGKIAEVIADPGPDWAAPPGHEVIDARGLWVLPGLVDAHSHAGGGDLNDMVYPVNHGFRVDDNIIVGNSLLRKAQAGGVTTILFIPGSGTNISGFGTVMKTAGRTREECIVRQPGCLKLAQGGNPERRGGDLGLTRMGMNWIIRHTLREAKAYHDAWVAWERDGEGEAPEKNPSLEPFRPVFRREIPVLVHTQGYHLIHSTLRLLRDELDLWVIIGHGTFDGHRMAPEVASRGVMVTNGPRQFRFDTRTGRLVGLAKEWHAGGVREVAVNTDAGVVPEEEFSYQGAMAVRLGLDQDVALRGLTISGAKILGIESRVGSLEAGKDADVVLWTGSPLDPRASVVMTIVDGRRAYDTREEPRRF